MTEWIETHVDLVGSWPFMAVVPVALAASLWIYQLTRPAVGAGVRRALVGLRWVSLGLLLAIAAEPVLGLRLRRAVRPLLLVLLDTSSSMAAEDAGRQRLARVKDLLADPEFGRLLECCQVTYRGFSEAGYAIPDGAVAALAPGGRATDLAGALAEGVRDIPPDSRLLGALILSDGAHNLGEDPIAVSERLAIPTLALGVGAAEGPADVQVTATVEPAHIRAGQSLPLQVQVRSRGYAGRTVELALSEDDVALARRSIILNGTGIAQQVRLDLAAPTVGPHIYRVSLPVLDGEQAPENNQALVFARVLPGKVPVLLLAGSPSPDLAFLRRGLVADSSLALEEHVARDGADSHGAFHVDADLLGSRDVVVLLDPAPELMRGEAASMLRGFVQEGGGLLFIAGPRSLRAWDPHSPIAGILPLQLDQGDQLEPEGTSVAVAQGGHSHPVIRGLSREATDSPAGAAPGDDAWDRLPPVSGRARHTQTRPGALVLLQQAGPGQAPLVATGVVGQGRIIAVMATGLWRLDLLSSGAGEQPEIIRRFWRRAVQWLALDTATGRVRASTERHVYRGGEAVTVAAEVFDELMRPQGEAEVEGRLGTGAAVHLESLGGGHYRGHWTGLAPGEYEFQVVASAGETPIGSDEGRFVVEERSLESMDVGAQLEVLAAMARASGGAYHPLEEWRNLSDRLRQPPRLVEETREYSLWGQGWVLVVVLGMLSGEWVLRKRNGMM